MHGCSPFSHWDHRVNIVSGESATGVTTASISDPKNGRVCSAVDGDQEVRD